MESIKYIFWNDKEKRFRSLWRLTGQALIALPLLIILGSIAGVFAFGMLVTQSGLTPQQMADPFLVRSAIMDSPQVLMIAYLGMVPAVVISIWLAGRLLDRRSFVDFGFHLNRDWWIDFGFGLGLGAGLMLCVFLVEWSLGWVEVTGTLVTKNKELSFLSALLFPMGLFLMVGFYEELFSRGYQLQNIAEGLNSERWGPRAAILVSTLLSSIIFGMLHSTNPHASVFSTFNIILAGVFLAVGYILTGELAIPIGVHITWNFFQGNVFGFPVSGGDFRSATFIAVRQGGPDWVTGGAFGPEGGLLGLVMILLGMGLTTLWVKGRYGKVSLHLPLAFPPHRSESE